MNKITKKMLNDFSLEHFTYINQFFGDQTVREIISEIYKNKTWEFHVEIGVGEFRGSHHHVLRKKKNKDVIWCSVDEKIQNMKKNVNDTLCQSYSLLKYKRITLDKKDSKANQEKMIKLYRTIIKNKHFKKHFSILINDPDNSEIYKIFLKNDKEIPMLMNFTFIMNNIEKTLDNWESYGYRYFIGKSK
jgi:hypothetical protein